ncbi:DUF2934 domain-containing protein [Pseudomonas sp. NPDC086251]|uniref:DUF2934 domain-containing protein n=1 Tax=Pseudomonas sp. NPDC086251 TaxID=3364431 RepID=UPI003838EDF7
MTEESKIREKAYDLWEKDGRPEGAEEFYWRLAQDQLEGEVKSSDTPEPGSPVQSFSQADDGAPDSEWPAKGEASRYEGT